IRASIPPCDAQGKGAVSDSAPPVGHCNLFAVACIRRRGSRGSVVGDEGVLAFRQLQPFGMRQGAADIGESRLPVFAHGHAAELIVLEMAETRTVAVDQMDQAV